MTELIEHALTGGTRRFAPMLRSTLPAILEMEIPLADADVLDSRSTAAIGRRAAQDAS
ncbi:MAG: hypothetical protein OXG72_19295 [Acidobacteria bacterium]|nr:hypothetical protein [Acidobacteriota bacterium]